MPLENQTFIVSNKGKFGRGSSAHGNPEETLGHIHFLRDAETPDIITATQFQSDPFQSTYYWKYDVNVQTRKIGNDIVSKKEMLKTASGDSKKAIEAEIKTLKNELEPIVKANTPNYEQKVLLEAAHEERMLQEFVDYAGKRGDVNKIRIPTSETAAKVQGYSRINNRELLDEVNILKMNLDYEKEVLKTNLPSEQYKNNVKLKITELEIKLAEAEQKLKNAPIKYSPEHQTILKKYSEQPKTIKKLFGVEPKIVTDSKGNTWYEFDIPESFKGMKGEIKAFSMGGMITPPAAVIGAGFHANKLQLEPQISFKRNFLAQKNRTQTLDLMGKTFQKGGPFQPGQIYTYDTNPEVFYKLDDTGNIVVKNKKAGSNEYVPMKDPKGTRRKTLEQGLTSGKTNLYGTPEQYAEYSNKDSAINDFFFSENEAAKEIHQTNASQCLKDSPNCLSSAWLYYDRHLASNLGLPSSWQLKENAGIYSGPKETNLAFPKYGESADSWDIARAIMEGQGKSYYAAKDDLGEMYTTKKFWKDLNLPVGAIINAGSRGGGLKYGRGDTYNEGAGLVPSNHSAMVVGYDAEGIPYIYDYGKIVKATDPKALINSMGVTNIIAPKELTGQTYASLKKQNKLKDEITDLKFNISDNVYNQISDIDEYKPFIKNLESNKSEIMSALGISNKTYDEYARRAAAIALTETEGGNDASIRWKGIIPVPSYITDKIGFGSSQGITQINTDVLFSSDKTKKQMNALGITKDNYDPYNSKHIAAATMIMLADADKVAMANLKKHSSNKQDLNPAAATYYQWNSPSTLVKGEAQGDNLNVKRFMNYYNLLKQYNKEDGGSVQYMSEEDIKKYRDAGYVIVEEPEDQ